MTSSVCVWSWENLQAIKKSKALSPSGFFLASQCLNKLAREEPRFGDEWTGNTVCPAPQYGTDVHYFRDALAVLDVSKVQP